MQKAFLLASELRSQGFTVEVIAEGELFKVLIIQSYLCLAA